MQRRYKESTTWTISWYQPGFVLIFSWINLKITGECNLNNILISTRFCANFLLNQLWCARHFSKILIPIHTMQIFQKDTYLCTLLSVCSCVSKKLWHFHFVWTQFIIGALLTQPAVRTFGKYLSLVKVSPQIEKRKKISSRLSIINIFKFKFWIFRSVIVENLGEWVSESLGCVQQVFSSLGFNLFFSFLTVH